MRKSKKEEPINEVFYRIEDLYREESIKISPPKNSLSEIVFNNHFEKLETILKNGISSIDDRDEIGHSTSWTPLYWAVKQRHIECVKLLLEYGATVNAVVNDMEECCGTVLDLATLRGDTEMELVLREYIERDNLATTNTPFKAIRTKLRGKAPAFNFTYYGKKKA